MEQNYTSLIEVFKKITTTTHEQFGKIYKENIFTDPTANLIVDGLVVQSKFIRNIVINGCGGTGGWFIPKLAKILIDANLKGKLAENITIYFCDGDTVAQKNLIRQNFILKDVGKNKAEVLANRYATIFPENVNIVFVDKYVANKQIIDSYDPIIATKFVDIATLPFDKMILEREHSHYTNLIFNFVDNAISRRCIHAFLYNAKTHSIVFDAGNNLYNGQVIVSKYYGNDFNHQLPSNYYLNNLQELEDNEFIKLDNCADDDLPQNNPEQMFNVNDFSATVTANIANNLFANSKIYHGVTRFVTGKSISIKTEMPFYDFNVDHREQPRLSMSTGCYHFARNSLHLLRNNGYSGNLYHIVSNLENIFGISIRSGYQASFQNIGLYGVSETAQKIISSDVIANVQNMGKDIHDPHHLTDKYLEKLSLFEVFVNEKKAAEQQA